MLKYQSLFFLVVWRTGVLFHLIFPRDPAGSVPVICHDYVAEVALLPSTSWRKDVTGVRSDSGDVTWRLTAKCERWLFTASWCRENHKCGFLHCSDFLFINRVQCRNGSVVPKFQKVVYLCIFFGVQHYAIWPEIEFGNLKQSRRSDFPSVSRRLR